MHNLGNPNISLGKHGSIGVGVANDVLEVVRCI